MFAPPQTLSALGRASHRTLMWSLASAVVLPVVLLSGMVLGPMASPASAQDGKPRFKDTSNPRVPPPSEFLPGMDSPQARFLAIGPLLDKNALGKADQLKAARGDRAKSLGVSEQRLALWQDLFFNNGASGLGTLGEVDLRQYALDLAGTWQLGARVIEGREVRATTAYLWELLELSDTNALFNTLLLEEGVFEEWLNLPPANGETYTLGSFGKVTLELVEGEGKYGLVKGETAIRQVWHGEILGNNYPGTETPVTIMVESLVVRQGSRYNQAWAMVHINEMNQRPSDYQTVQLVPSMGSDSSIWVSHRFDSEDDYEKVADRVPVSGLDRYWARAKRRPAQLLSPHRVLDVDAARRVLRADP